MKKIKARHTVGDILQWLEAKAPASTAESWDNVGLLVGKKNWKVERVVVAIELTADTLDHAIASGAQLIVNHHPCIFPRGHGLSKVSASGRPDDESKEALILRAIENRVAIIASHTNFDRCALEVVDRIAQGLGVQAKGRLHDVDEPLIKLSVFVPPSHVDPVRRAICEAGAGQIGNYDFCTFSSSGEGTFRGLPGTQPFLGKTGVFEKVSEFRLEALIPRGLESAILTALKNSHPYEEVAYDLVPVEQRAPATGIVRGLGYGFWGEIPGGQGFSELAQNVRNLFNISGFLMTAKQALISSNDRFSNFPKVHRVAFVAGKGSSFVQSAASMDCDVFITGEVGYHKALDGMRRDMMVMEIGHRESERLFLDTVQGWFVELDLKTIRHEEPNQKIVWEPKEADRKRRRKL